MRRLAEIVKSQELQDCCSNSNSIISMDAVCSFYIGKESSFLKKETILRYFVTPE